jgi:hypothetical protein
MNTVQIVTPTQIHDVWNKVEGYLNASLKISGDDCTLDQLKLLLVKGFQILLISVDDQKNINGAMTVEFIDYPNRKVLFITGLGGVGVVNDETFSQVENWARSQGATKVYAWAKEAQAKLYKLKANFNNVRMVVEKDL